VSISERPLTLEEAQEVVVLHAPHLYYRDAYRAMERDYLPHLCRAIDGREPGRVLDIGPGWGTMMVWLASRGHEVTVLDLMPPGTFLTPNLVELAGARYLQADISEGPVEELRGGMDLVLMTQVLPHLKWQPEEAVRHAAAMLAPGGEFVASALDADCYPNLACTHGTCWQMVPRWGKGEASPDEVVCMFTAGGLAELLCRVFPPGVAVCRDASSSVLLGFGHIPEE